VQAGSSHLSSSKESFTCASYRAGTLSVCKHLASSSGRRAV
jgi:hypothetical protein